MPTKYSASSAHQTWQISTHRSIQYSLLKCDHIFDNPTTFEKNFLPPFLSSTSSLTPETSNLSPNIRRFIVIDTNVLEIYGSKIKNYFAENNITIELYEFLAGEHHKNIASYFDLIQSLKIFGITRRSEPILAIGGGVLTDVVGFAASTYRRGIPHINIPTTLMGYVDASIGIKCGLDYHMLKNRIGSFYPPQKVILDKSFFLSLSDRHIRNGIGEILKIGIIKDYPLFELLEQYGKVCIKNKFQDFSNANDSQNKAQEILDRSVTCMLQELESNLFEENLNRPMDFGHTFSTSIEMLPERDIYHGEAVILDLYISCVLSYQRALLPKVDFSRIISLAKTLQLNLNFQGIHTKLLWDSILERIEHRNGMQRIPLPSSIGTCSFVNDITENEVHAAISYIKKRNLNEQ